MPAGLFPTGSPAALWLRACANQDGLPLIGTIPMRLKIAIDWLRFLTAAWRDVHRPLAVELGLAMPASLTRECAEDVMLSSIFLIRVLRCPSMCNQRVLIGHRSKSRC